MFDQIGADLKFYDWEATWWTSLPPSDPYDQDKQWRKLLDELGWIDHKGEWVGPEVGMHEYSDRGSAIADAVRRTPANMLNLQGEWQPISMVASEIVTDHVWVVGHGYEKQ